MTSELTEFEKLAIMMRDAFAEQREYMDTRFAVIDQRFDAIHQEMNERFEAAHQEMNERFDQVHGRFNLLEDEIEGKFFRQTGHVSGVKITVDELYREVKDIKKRLEYLERFPEAQESPYKEDLVDLRARIVIIEERMETSR